MLQYFIYTKAYGGVVARCTSAKAALAAYNASIRQGQAVGLRVERI